MALAIANERVIIVKGIILTSSPFVSLHYWATKQNKTKQTHSHTFDTLFFCLQWEEWMCPCRRLVFPSIVLLLRRETWTWPCGGVCFVCANAWELFICFFVIAMRNFLFFFFKFVFVFGCETRGIGARRRKSSNFSFVFCCYDTTQDMGT